MLKKSLEKGSEEYLEADARLADALDKMPASLSADMQIRE
jgi:hypothetical protein